MEIVSGHGPDMLSLVSIVLKFGCGGGLLISADVAVVMMMLLCMSRRCHAAPKGHDPKAPRGESCSLHPPLFILAPLYKKRYFIRLLLLS